MDKQYSYLRNVFVQMRVGLCNLHCIYALLLHAILLKRNYCLLITCRTAIIIKCRQCKVFIFYSKIHRFC